MSLMVGSILSVLLFPLPGDGQQPPAGRQSCPAAADAEHVATDDVPSKTFSFSLASERGF